MGLKVTAEQAGQLVDRAERIVRGRIAKGDLPAVKEGNSWRIDVDDLERIPGWRVDRGRLAQLTERDARTAEGIAARMAAFERELESLRRRVRILEAGRLSPASAEGADTAERHETRSEGAESLLGVWGGSSYSPGRYSPSVERYSASPARVATAQRAPGVLPNEFTSRAARATWLERHGVPFSTSRNLHSPWRDCPMGTPRDILQWVIDFEERMGWRATSKGRRFHRCEDPLCPCYELLPD